MAHILIVEAPYYAAISEELGLGAIAELDAQGATYDRVTVFGVFELPAAIAMAHSGQPGRYDGYLALGCVIRGETTHYDYVCNESARGLMNLSVQHHLAIGYGVVTVENEAQAWARPSRDKKNKGKDAAAACLRMIALRRNFDLT
ncbi:MAG TPA: 6,7-dimethyl-8-ribityllumazine synthase [Rhodospirillaceae bacterium]|nr:6,7-dimethyl-8-ribityllumazine synthase [Rhodospirillaceae bacterium]